MEMFQKGASPFRCSNSIFKEEYMGEKRYIISDASKMLNVESHVLRYWEEELEIKIPRNEMGHRYYTEGNLESLRKVRDLKKQGYSLKAIKNMVNPKKGARENKESNETADFADGSKGEKSRGGELLSGSAGGNVWQCTECGTEYDTE